MNTESLKGRLLPCLPLEMQQDAQLIEYLIRVVESLHATPLPVSVVEKTLHLVLKAAGLSEPAWDALWKIIYANKSNGILANKLLVEEDLGLDGIDLDSAAAVVPFERPVQMDANEGTAISISGSGSDYNSTTTNASGSALCPELVDLLGIQKSSSSSSAAGGSSIDFLSNRK